jgi:uncharacterized protein
MIGISHNSVNIAMRDLAATNLFTFKPAGHAHIYSINKNSALFPVIESLFKGEVRLREDLIDTVSKGVKGIGTCIMFGSYARGDETLDSDLDLLIITDDKNNAKKACDDLLLQVRVRFDVHISPMILTENEFRSKRNRPVYKNAISEGKLIAGKMVGV